MRVYVKLLGRTVSFFSIGHTIRLISDKQKKRLHLIKRTIPSSLTTALRILDILFYDIIMYIASICSGKPSKRKKKKSSLRKRIECLDNITNIPVVSLHVHKLVFSIHTWLHWVFISYSC